MERLLTSLNQTSVDYRQSAIGNSETAIACNESSSFLSIMDCLSSPDVRRPFDPAFARHILAHLSPLLSPLGRRFIQLIVDNDVLKTKR